MTTPVPTLRDRLRAPAIVEAMAAHSPLSARLAEEAGFGALWASGFELSALYGVPDLSLLSMTQHLDMVRAMAEQVSLPIVADIDTGFGNALNVIHAVERYEAAGASACSILTEPEFFGGSLDDLRAARAATRLPLLRKDFIVDEYQLAEARHAGADAALLIVAALEPERLTELISFAQSLGLDTLIEVHEDSEVEVAVDAGAEIIGINNRNLKSLDVDTETVFELLSDIPAGTVVVAESGISERGDVLRLEEAGVDAILVGEALMGSDDMARSVKTLLGT